MRSAKQSVRKGALQGGEGAARGTHGEWGGVDGIEGLFYKFVRKIGLRGVYRVFGGSGKTHRFKQSEHVTKREH